MSKFKNSVVIVFLLGISMSVYSQEQTEDATFKIRYKTWAVIIEGDTVPSINLPEFICYADYPTSNKQQYEAWTKTKYNVKNVYPYAIIAAARLKEYDMILNKITDEKTKKAYLKVAEKELKAEFGAQLRDLTITQGRILLKLIDRETGTTSYSILKEYRGGFQAFMWQSVAKLFGNNMKSEYDPKGEDIMIERAITLIEAGQF
jgi:hypothetical protein